MQGFRPKIWRVNCFGTGRANYGMHREPRVNLVLVAKQQKVCCCEDVNQQVRVPVQFGPDRAFELSSMHFQELVFPQI